MVFSNTFALHNDAQPEFHRSSASEVTENCGRIASGSGTARGCGNSYNLWPGVP
jgi:hypothetical protein